MGQFQRHANSLEDTGLPCCRGSPGRSFRSSPPNEITALLEWQQVVAPWWDDYTSPLAEIPMTVQQDISATNDVVKRLGLLLQRWALGIGFDLQDTDQGGFFRIMLWD